jgi:LysR family transcriptional regulator, nod-box dependent transcriptional activator
MRLDRLDLNLIIALEAILRLRSVSGAASELNLTQPAMSRSLGRLREHFRDPIVFQVGRQMQPTEFGARLYRTGGRLLNEVRNFSQMRPDFDPTQARRTFSLMASDFVLKVWIAPMLARLSEAAPGVSLSVVPIDQTSDARFTRGEIDFAVVPDRFLFAEHPHRFMFSDAFVCVFWAGNTAIGDTLDVDTYLSLRHVVTTFGSAWRGSHFEHWMEERQEPLKVACSLPSFSLLADCLTGTPWIATIHRSLWDSLPEGVPLRALPHPLPLPEIVENLQWHRSRQDDDSIAWMRDFILTRGAPDEAAAQD